MVFSNKDCQFLFDYGEGSGMYSGFGEGGFEASAPRFGVVEEESQAGLGIW